MQNASLLKSRIFIIGASILILYFILLLIIYITAIKPVEDLIKYDTKIFLTANRIESGFRQIDILFQNIAIYQKENKKIDRKKYISEIKSSIKRLDGNIAAFNEAANINKKNGHMKKYLKPFMHETDTYWNNIYKPIAKAYIGNNGIMSRKISYSYLIFGLNNKIPYFAPVARKALKNEIADISAAERKTTVIFIGINLLLFASILVFLYFISKNRLLEGKLKELEAIFSTDAITIEDLTESLFNSLKKFMNINRLAFASVEGNKVIASIACSDSKDIKIEPGYNELLSEVSLRNLKKNDIRIINNIEELLKSNPNSKSTKLIYDEGMRSSLTFPIYDGHDGLLGFLFLNSFDKNAFKDEDAEKLKYASKFIAISYEKTFLVSKIIMGIILGFAKMVEEKDEGTMGHIFRMASYSRLIAAELSRDKKFNIGGKYVEDLYRQATLHDLGKISIPDSILLKHGKLTAEEFDIMKKHTTIGYDILENINTNTKYKKGFFELGKLIAKYHQEKWDGSGYPEGLKGENIPLCGRITAVADVFDALTSERPYKRAFTFDESYNIIVKNSGTHFDPDIVSAFINISGKIRDIYDRYNKNI